MIPVQSSNIDAVDYDPTCSKLTVRFKNSGVYIYDKVSQEEFEGLISAESVGKYLNKVIKNDNHPYTKVA